MSALPLSLTVQKSLQRSPQMSLTVAVQMDPIEKIRIAGDSTFALLLAAQERGHRLLYYTPDRLSMRDGQVVARVQALSVRDVEGDHYGLGEPERIDLATVDVVLNREGRLI